jgi:hypothetical protein
MKMGGYGCDIEDGSRAEKQFDKLKFAGSAGETRGVPRFDFWISCWQRKI